MASWRNHASQSRQAHLPEEEGYRDRVYIWSHLHCLKEVDFLSEHYDTRR